MYLLLVLVFSLLVSASLAQTGTPKTPTELNTEVNQQLVSGSKIRAQQLRQILLDMIASDLNLPSTLANANQMWAGPITGDPAAPAFRALDPSDLPSALVNGVQLPAAGMTDGFDASLAGISGSAFKSSGFAVSPGGRVTALAVTATTTVRMTPVAFATLATCDGDTEGTMAAVNDSSTVVWGDTVTGSSTNHVLAYCDGTVWTVAGK